MREEYFKYDLFRKIGNRFSVNLCGFHETVTRGCAFKAEVRPGFRR